MVSAELTFFTRMLHRFTTDFFFKKKFAISKKDFYLCCRNFGAPFSRPGKQR
jgi:hypothetical protein